MKYGEFRKAEFNAQGQGSMFKLKVQVKKFKVESSKLKD